jgi:hypothetical protein
MRYIDELGWKELAGTACAIIADHRQHVNAINHQTITRGDRFVFSPFESVEISKLMRGESQNMHVVSSPPPPVR